MLTWWVVAIFAVGVYALRAGGAVLVDPQKLDPRSRRVLETLPLAIIAALVALATFSDDGELGLDARAAGVGAAALCAWRKLPMIITVVVAAATTAAVRQLTT